MGDEQIPRELIAGKYRLTRLLGRGGMGSVWEGVHSTLGTRVACKFIEAEYADSAEARSRFENEARAAAALRSKHVVEVHDHGVTDDGRPYIVMEYLTGEPLDKRLERSGRISLQETAGIINHVSRALSKAHPAGIVHRDLKPENIFLVWDDEDSADIAKVVDFGIAKFTDKSVGISSATRTGSVLGTPYYMSPEQARGLRSVDYRSDLWSLGVITFRCVVGRLPFDGEALGDLLVKLCTAPIPVPSQQLPGLPPAFDAWMSQALARDPAQRFADARTMAEALAQVAGLTPRGRMSSAVDPDASGPVQAFAGAAASGGLGSSQGVTPHPAADRIDRGTPYPESHPAGNHTYPVSPSQPSASTDAALTATPFLPKRSSRTPLLLAAGVTVILGIGAAVLSGPWSGQPALESAASAAEGPVDKAAAAAAAPATGISAPEPAPAPPEPVVLGKSPDLTLGPGEESEPAPAPQKARKAFAQPTKPKAAPQPAAVAPEPAAPEPPSDPEPAPPKVEPPPKRVAVPKPVVTVKKKPGIDVGY